MIGGLTAAMLSLAGPSSADQKILDQIAVSCGLRANDVTIEEGKLVRIIPKGAPPEQKLMCLLPKLKEAGFVTKVGFVSEPPVETKN